MKKPKFTYVPNARIFINGIEQSPTLQERINILAAHGVPSRELKNLANDFGGYLEIKLRPITS